MPTCRHNMPTCRHNMPTSNMHVQDANMQAQYASCIQNMPTCRHNMPTCHMHEQLQMCTSSMPTCIYICQHVICSATCRHACTRCVRNMHREVLSTARVSTHPPAYHRARVFRSMCQSLQKMASFGCVSGRSPL